jgi:hypothetical protein
LHNLDTEKGEGKKQQQKNLPVRGDTDEEEVPSLLAIIIRNTSGLFTAKLFDEFLRILSLKEEEKEYHPDCLPACLQGARNQTLLQAKKLASLT